MSSNWASRISSGTSRNTPCHDCWLKMTNPPAKISSRPISTEAARSQFTRHYASTTQRTTSRGVRTPSTFAHDLTSWSSLLTTITPTLIDMADSSTSSRFPSTTKARRNSSVGPGEKKSKSSGYAGSNWTLLMRMDSPTFASHGCSLLNQMVQLIGTVLSHRPMSYVQPT